ncbi:hypothetical protein Aperf_G00000002379 [Anoplocephala perfoliata]
MSDKNDQPSSDPPSNENKETQESIDESPDVIVVNDDSDGDDDYDDDDDYESSQDELCIDSVSDDDEMKWKSAEILQTLVSEGYRNPGLILNRLFEIDLECLPSSESQLWRILSTLFAERSVRRPLKQYCTLQSVIDLLKEKSKILVLTGAGISVSCGIPDFRSRDGVYARLERDFPDLRSPQDMFDLAFFKSNPNPFFTFAKELFPGQFKPSFTHRFVRLLEKKSKLLRNYTQNIDTLEEVAGISRIIPCHGSFATASCLNCKFKVQGEAIREAIMSQRIPYCPKCCPEVGLKGLPAVSSSSSATEPVDESKPPPPVTAVMKPDIVFFGESLPSEFHATLEKDVKDVDLVLVMGSSLKVRPVSYIPNNIPHSVPQILINRELLSNHRFDVELLGDCDTIIEHLCNVLGWNVDSDCDSDSASQEKTAGRPLTQVDLIVPLKAGLEALANEPDSSPSVPGPEGDMDTVDSEVRKEEAVDAKPSETENTADSKEQPDKKEAMKADGTLECPINVDDDDDSDPDYIEEEDYYSSSENRRTIELAKYLPENSYTSIPKRLYVFQGSELDISAEMAEKYVAAHSQPNGSNGDDCPLSSEGSQSPSSSIEGEEESFVDYVLRRCRHDSELENERKKCVEGEGEDNENVNAHGSTLAEEANQEVIEIINCDDSSSGSIHEDLTTPASLETSNAKSRETKKTTPCEPLNGIPPKTKRRRCNSNVKTNEEEGEESSESTKTIFLSSSSLNDGKAVNV